MGRAKQGWAWPKEMEREAETEKNRKGANSVLSCLQVFFFPSIFICALDKICYIRKFNFAVGLKLF